MVNEGITMHRVIYYLAVIVEGREKLLVAFPVRFWGAGVYASNPAPTQRLVGSSIHPIPHPNATKPQRLQPRLEELLPVYESLKRVLAATTRAQRERGHEGGGPEGMAGGD